MAAQHSKAAAIPQCRRRRAADRIHDLVRLELLLSPLLLVGLFTRPVAFILAGLLAFAYFIGHAPRSFYPSINGGNLAILYCFVFSYLVIAGGGAWSLDRVIWRKPAWD